MARPQYPQRGQGPAGGLADGAVGTSEIAASAITQPKLGADSAGLTAVADPVMRRTFTMRCATTVTAADNYPLLRAGDEAPQILGCYVNPGVEIGHGVENLNGTWIFTLRNVSKGVNLNANAASLSGVTLAATAWKSIPVNNGNGTLTAGDSLQLQLTESGAAFTMDQLAVMLEFEPTVNS
jgi:hypothetical protein